MKGVPSTFVNSLSTTDHMGFSIFFGTTARGIRTLHKKMPICLFTKYSRYFASEIERNTKSALFTKQYERSNVNLDSIFDRSTYIL